MKKFVPFGLACLLLAFPTIGFAQQTDNPDVPDRADVVKFLDLMHARTQMTQVVDGMVEQMKVGARDGFKQRVPDATPEQLAKLDKIFDSLFASLPLDDMVDAIVPIYQKHLTKTDLAAVTAFYSSPAGQKILKELPAIMSESMQAGGEIGRKAFAAKSKELERQMDDLAKGSKKD